MEKLSFPIMLKYARKIKSAGYNALQRRLLLEGIKHGATYYRITQRRVK